MKANTESSWVGSTLRSTSGHEDPQWDTVSMDRLKEILPETTQEVDLRLPTTRQSGDDGGETNTGTKHVDGQAATARLKSQSRL